MVTWSKKYSSFALLAGLILLINSCAIGPAPKLELRAIKPLSHFPSASAVEYSNQRLYLFGDDATYALILDTALNEVDTISYLSGSSGRMNKEQKPDIESATLISYEGSPAVVALGSMATPQRQSAFVFPLATIYLVQKMPLRNLAQALRNVPELNIEGAALVKEKLVLANRAHLKNRTNSLLLVNIDDTTFSNPHTLHLHLKPAKALAGLSGLYYLAETDRLLFTASEEATASTHDDGAIGNSYLGWIDGFSKKMRQHEISADALLPLQLVHPAFTRTKIESVCATQINRGSATLVLTADNDDGKSTLYKVVLFD
jgi:hypothetical protein